MGFTWLGLAMSAGLAIVLTAAQLLPVIEFTGRTMRAVVGPHDLYRFSIEPFRLVELALAQRHGCPVREGIRTGATP